MDWFFSYSHQMVDEAAAAKEAMYTALRNRDWQINDEPVTPGPARHRLIDDHGLEAGDFWTHQLLDWLHTCEGGILFFTEDRTLNGASWEQQIEQRRWLYMEAFLLIVRKVRGHLSRCVPIFVNTHRDTHPVARFICHDWPGLTEKRLAIPPQPAELQTLIAALELTPVAGPRSIEPHGAKDDAFDDLISSFVCHITEATKKRVIKLALKGSTNPGMLAAADLDDRLRIRLNDIRGVRELMDEACLNLAVAEIILGGPMQGDMRHSPLECTFNHLTMLCWLVDDFRKAAEERDDYGRLAQVGKAVLSTKWVSPEAVRSIAGALCNGTRVFVVVDRALLDGKRGTKVAPAQNLAVLDELLDAGKCLGSTDENTNLNDLSDRIAKVCRPRATVSRDEQIAARVYHIEEPEAALAKVIADIGGLLDRRRHPIDPVVVIDSTGSLLANAKLNARAAPKRGRPPEDSAAPTGTRLDGLLAASRPKYSFRGVPGIAGEPPFDPLYVFSFATDLSRERLVELSRTGAQLVIVDLEWRENFKAIITC